VLGLAWPRVEFLGGSSVLQRVTPMENLIQHLRDSQALAKLVGKAPAFVRAIKKLPAVAKSGATVLITGETGTGKELVARAVHYLSDRASQPFVALNCGSLPDTLLEDELFGHERGAFTGAHVRREGLIAQAEKGTLFLDEVDTLPAKAQIDLLRVLQDKRFRTIGSSVEHKADVRILAASNAVLELLVQSGSFRADLYYRLLVFPIFLPVLRDRREDIPALAAHFLEKHALPDKPDLSLTPAAREALLSFDWPGNVRELESAIIRGIHLSETGWIEVDDLGLQSKKANPPTLSSSNPAKLYPFAAMKREAIEGFERDYLTRLMSEHQGNVSRAALTAGKERCNLGKLLKKHRLDPKLFRCSQSPR
jgi:DNA-binding NtrC family response regulator